MWTENVNVGRVEAQLLEAKAKADRTASVRTTCATDVNSTAASMGEPGQTELTQSLLIRILYETLYWYVLSLQTEQNETEAATPDVTLDAEMPQ